MADFCSFCEPSWHDYDLIDIVSNLFKSEDNFYGPMLCEGCTLAYVFKEDGKLGAGFYDGGNCIEKFCESFDIDSLYLLIDDYVEKLRGNLHEEEYDCEDYECCINHCDVCNQCFWESHYHCGTCGNESGMMGCCG